MDIRGFFGSPHHRRLNITENVVNPRDDFCQFVSIHEKVVYKYTDDYFVCVCTVDELLRANIKNWEHNRPPDYNRCVSIAELIYVSNQPVTGVISIYMDTSGGNHIYYIVDGIHRYTALEHIKRENSKSEDLITPNQFGHNGNAKWLYDSPVLVCIRKNMSKPQVADWFRAINNSNPVPELYINETKNEKMVLIESIVEEWTQKYKTHFTSSVHYQRPNITRDAFIGLLDKMYDLMKITKDNEIELLWKLENLNLLVQTTIPRKPYPKSSWEKCVKTGCYLFLWKPDVIIEFV